MSEGDARVSLSCCRRLKEKGLRDFWLNQLDDPNNPDGVDAQAVTGEEGGGVEAELERRPPFFSWCSREKSKKQEEAHAENAEAQQDAVRVVELQSVSPGIPLPEASPVPQSPVLGSPAHECRLSVPNNHRPVFGDFDKNKRAAHVDVTRAWWTGLLTGLVAMFVFPMLVLRRLGDRLHFEGFVLATVDCCLLWLLAVASVFIPLFLPRYLSGEAYHFGMQCAVAVWLFLLTCVFLPWIYLTRKDAEWSTIDNLRDHTKLTRWSIGNCFAILSNLLQFLQILAHSFRIVPILQTDGDAGMKGFSALVGVFLGSFKNVYVLSFSLAVGGVGLWNLLFAGFGYQLLSASRKNVGFKASLYERFGASWMYPLFMLLSDVLFLTISTNLLEVLSCTFDHAEDEFILDVDAGVVCWKPPHSTYACVAMLAVLFYMPHTLLFAPFSEAESDGKFSSASVNVRYTANSILTVRICLLLMSGVSIFVGDALPWLSLLAISALNFSLSYSYWKSKPCSIPWVNASRQSLFLTCALVPLALLASYTSELWPVIALLSLVFVCCTFQFLWQLHRLKNSDSAVDIGDFVGSCNPEQDLLFLDDMAASSRLSRLRFLFGGGVVVDVQASYQLGKSNVSGPTHFSCADTFITYQREVRFNRDEWLNCVECWTTEVGICKLVLRVRNTSGVAAIYEIQPPPEKQVENHAGLTSKAPSEHASYLYRPTALYLAFFAEDARSHLVKAIGFVAELPREEGDAGQLCPHALLPQQLLPEQQERKKRKKRKKRPNLREALEQSDPWTNYVEQEPPCDASIV